MTRPSLPGAGDRPDSIPSIPPPQAEDAELSAEELARLEHANLPLRALYADLPEPPRAPPYARLEAALGAAERARVTAGRWGRLAWAASALLALGGLVWAQGYGPSPDPREAGPDANSALEVLATLGPGLESDGQRDRSTASAGAWLHAPQPAEALLNGRVRLVLDAGTRLQLRGAEAVELRAGRALFEVEPGPFVVHTPQGDVRVRGTRFEVDLRSALTLEVFEGEVECAAVRLRAGQRWERGGTGELAAPDAPPPGPRWFEGTPVLSLLGPAVASPGETVLLTLVFANPTGLRQRLDGPATVASAALLSLSDPEGRQTSRPLDLAQAEGGALAPGRALVLAPGERRSVSLRVELPAGPVGAWRLGALYRPGGTGRLGAANARPDGQAPLTSLPHHLEIR